LLKKKVDNFGVPYDIQKLQIFDVAFSS